MRYGCACVLCACNFSIYGYDSFRDDAQAMIDIMKAINHVA